MKSPLRRSFLVVAIGLALVILTLGSRRSAPRSLKEEFDERAERLVKWCNRRWPQSIRESARRKEMWYERQSRIDCDCMDMLMESLTGVSLPPVMVPMKEHLIGDRMFIEMSRHDVALYIYHPRMKFASFITSWEKTLCKRLSTCSR